jgi:hypothetical protein
MEPAHRVEDVNAPPHSGDGLSDDMERKVTHFIPSVELKGNLTEKLAKLDRLIEHLVTLRRALADDAPAPPDRSSPVTGRTTRGDAQWAAGLLLAGALLLTLGARACAP